MTEELSIKLTADLSQFTKGLDRALQKVDEVGQKMESAGKKMTLGLTVPITAMGGAAVSSAVKFEKLETSLAVLTGSAENGAKAFERLKQFSASTPFQLADLVSVNNQLLGFGMSVDGAFNSLKMLGDVAAVSGADLSRVAVAFGQSAAAGRVMTQDLNQFINNGIPIYQILGDITGKNVGELRDLASQGGITFDLLQKGFEKATSEGGTFYQGTLKLSKTLGGRLSTLKDNIDILAASFGEIIGEYLDPFISLIQEAAVNFKNLDENTKKTIVQIAAFAAAIGPVLATLGVFSTTVLPAMAAGFAALTSPITLVIAAIGALGAAIAYTWDNWAAIKERISDISWWTNVLIDMAQFVLKYNPIQLLIKPFEELLKALGIDLPNPFDSISDALNDLRVETKDYEHEFGSFTDAIKNAAKQAFNSLSGVSNIMDKISNKTNTTTRSGVSVGESSGLNTSSDVMISPDSFLGTDLSQIENLDQASKDFFNQRSNELMTLDGLSQTFGQSFNQAFNTVLNTSEDFGHTMINVLKDIFKQMAKNIAQMLVFNAISSAFGGGLLGSFLPPIGIGGGGPSNLIPGLGKMGSYPMNVNVFGRISGQDILLSNERASYNRERERGF